MAITACTSIPKTERPNIPLETAATQIVPAFEIEKDWWQSFQSVQLNQMIEVAQKQNPDLRIAGERVRQAELQMRIAGASLFPSFTINGSTGSGRSRFDGGEWDTSESSRVGLGASYEVDLWGRVSAGVSGARAGYASRQFDEAAAQLSVSGAVASAWFQWLTLQQRIASAEENIRIAERIAQIVQVRYDNGAASAADVSRQRTNLLSQQSALLPLQLQARQTRAALALLLGESPLEFDISAQERLLDLALPEVGDGIPADLLTRRPDLASVEAQLQAADADVAAARAALLPGVQLSASAARSSAALLSLSPPTDSLSWSLGLAQTLFNGGRLRNQVKLSESQRVALVEQYRKAILTALQETADAFDRRTVSAEQEGRQREILAEAERTLRLVETRYREGTDDLMSLLEAQRTVFQARDQLAQQRRDRLDATVDLYLALGGGWK
ncbi:MAG: efflux transporter outer membrane subunit [Cellvibrionaceae bacterium]|nr:efflux transporter outer membrane subunit [Cellvibrionaceae bacterium]